MKGQRRNYDRGAIDTYDPRQALCFSLERHYFSVQAQAHGLGPDQFNAGYRRQRGVSYIIESKDREWQVIDAVPTVMV